MSGRNAVLTKDKVISIRSILFLLFAPVALVSAYASDRTSEIANYYREREGLEADARGSTDSLQRLKECGGDFEELEKRWQDGVAAAELHLLGEGEDRAYFAARAAWRYLAGSEGRHDQLGEQRRKAYRLYNLACSACASQADWSQLEWKAGGVTVQMQRSGFLGEPISDVVPACLQDTKGYGERVLRQGIGGAVFVVMPQTKERETLWPHLPPVDFPYGANAILRFDTDLPQLVLHDSLVDETIELFGSKKIPLHADFTAPFAAIAAQRDFDGIGQQGAFAPRLDLETLYHLEPPRNDKIPILFVHGLQSSPKAYREMAVALRADPEIRRHYQFIVYQYPTGYPLALLNAHMRKVTADFWKWFDNKAPKAREQGYIAIGHSLGGLQIKSLAVSSDRNIWDVIFVRDPSEVDLSEKEGELLRRMTMFEPDPNLARLVFMAVPHRGSPWSTGVVKAVGKAMYDEDPDVRKLRETILERYGDKLHPEFRERISVPRASIDNLDPDAPYLQAFAKLALRPGLPYHSIIGDVDGNSDAPEGDGVVPYQSAHLDGAESELVIKSGHSIQRTPQAIAELKRILQLHLSESKNGR